MAMAIVCRDVLRTAWWLCPSVAIAALSLFYASSEADLHCGPEDWTPMITSLGNLYFPKRMSDAGNKTLLCVQDMRLINPFLSRPSLVLPCTNHSIPTGAGRERGLYFISELGLVQGVTCMLLEAVRWIVSPGKDADCKPQPQQRGAGYLFLFVSYNVACQLLLDMLMDFGVYNGLMNLTTGLAGELWVPFVGFVLLVDFISGTLHHGVNFICAHCEHPSPLMCMELLPWLGNELHIMKDHVALALCFAAALCQTGPLRTVGIALGHLSIASTFVPLIPLVSDASTFEGMCQSHWPLPESVGCKDIGQRTSATSVCAKRSSGRWSMFLSQCKPKTRRSAPSSWSSLTRCYRCNLPSSLVVVCSL